ncbi:hypothetical protein ACWD7F_35915 [Streptomyces sp. NPDC005122]
MTGRPRSGAGAAAYVVDTVGGKVRGAEIGDGVLGRRGIPYAAPPVGSVNSCSCGNDFAGQGSGHVVVQLRQRALSF